MKTVLTQFIEHTYHGYHKVNIHDLRKHIESIAILGSITIEDEMEQTQNLDWDILHIQQAIDDLDLEHPLY